MTVVSKFSNGCIFLVQFTTILCDLCIDVSFYILIMIMILNAFLWLKLPFDSRFLYILSSLRSAQTLPVLHLAHTLHLRQTSSLSSVITSHGKLRFQLLMVALLTDMCDFFFLAMSVNKSSVVN